MLLDVYGFPLEYSIIRDQIFGSPIVTSLATPWSTLIRVQSKQPSNFVLTLAPVNVCALVSQGTSRGHTRGDQSSKDTFLQG